MTQKYASQSDPECYLSSGSEKQLPIFRRLAMGDRERARDSGLSVLGMANGH